MFEENATTTDAQSTGEQNRPAEIAGDAELSATHAAYECFRAYARERPGVVCLWCLGLGFVLGWKLKPW